MASRTVALTLGAVLTVVIGMVFFPAITSAVDGATGTQSVENETVTAQEDEWVDLEGYKLDSGTVTVYGHNESDDSYETATEGDDYEIRLDSGELQALNDSTLIDDGETVKVSYDYQASDATTTLVVGFVPVMVAVLLFWVIAQRAMDMM